MGRIDGVSREGGVDTTNGRIDHLELYKMGSFRRRAIAWICERRMLKENADAIRWYEPKRSLCLACTSELTKEIGFRVTVHQRTPWQA